MGKEWRKVEKLVLTLQYLGLRPNRRVIGYNSGARYGDESTGKEAYIDP